MKKEEEIQCVIPSAKSREQLMNQRISGSNPDTGMHIRIFVYLVLFSGIGMFLNSCVGGYVASEPVYTEYSRPPRPGANHIWISGDWGWNNQTHGYVQKTGYWEKPRQGQRYVEGSWQTSIHGKSWSKGHWQRQNR